MNQDNLASHLYKLGLDLKPERHGKDRWVTRLSSGYPYPTNRFPNLKSVQKHWKTAALHRLTEIKIAERVWKAAANNKVEQKSLLKWAEGKQFDTPESLLVELRAFSLTPVARWRQEIELACQNFGDAAGSWLHDAVLSQKNLEENLREH